MSLNRIFKPLWSADYDTAIITGGRASGKSHAVAQFLENLTFEPGHVILYSRYTLIAASQSVIPEFVDKIERLNHQAAFNVTRTDIENKLTGSRILFRGLHTSSGNQTAKLKSIVGLSTFVLDEAEEAQSETDFDVIDYSIRSKAVKNRVLLIMNPVTKEHWIYNRFFEQAGVEPGFNGVVNRVLYLHSTFKNNVQNLSPKFMSQVKQLEINNPQKYNHIIMGGWLARAEGAIYTNWRLGEFDDSIPAIYGMDFGFSYSEDALIKVAIDEKRKVLYAKQLLYKNGLTTPQLAEYMHRLVEANGLIIADSAEPRLILELRNAGLNVRETVKKHGSVLEGIRLVQDFEIIVDPGSVNLVKELNNYAWDDKKAEKPIQAFDHLLDGLRYSVSHQVRKSWVSF